MKLSTSILLIFIFSSLPFGNLVMRFILDEDISNCGTKEWLVDLSDFKLIMVNDTTTVANGTTKLKKTLEAPWKLHFYGEQFDRGQWTKRFERKFDDFCKYNLRIGEIWYDAMMKKVKGQKCPYKKDEVWAMENDVVYFDVSYMPPYFEGRWRFTMDGLLGCYRVNFDFVNT